MILNGNNEKKNYGGYGVGLMHESELRIASWQCQSTSKYGNQDSRRKRTVKRHGANSYATMTDTIQPRESPIVAGQMASLDAN